jgi:hypothetical protein
MENKSDIKSPYCKVCGTYAVITAKWHKSGPQVRIAADKENSWFSNTEITKEKVQQDRCRFTG